MFAVSGFGALSFTAYGTSWAILEPAFSLSLRDDDDKRQPGEIIVVVFALRRKKPQSHITKYQWEAMGGGAVAAQWEATQFQMKFTRCQLRFVRNYCRNSFE